MCLHLIFKFGYHAELTSNSDFDFCYRNFTFVVFVSPLLETFYDLSVDTILLSVNGPSNVKLESMLKFLLQIQTDYSVVI